MNDERWEQLREHLNKKFEIVEEKSEDLVADTGDGPVKQGTQDILVVVTPAGEIKVVREVRPKVLEKRMRYTHRQGASAQTEYVLSDTDKTYRLRIYRWNDLDQDWTEVDVRDVEGLI